MRGTNEADDKVVRLEGLMRRRRLVQAAGDRLEVGDVQRPRIQEAVPTDNVKRVIVSSSRPSSGRAP